ncbi:streptolysin associated protein SagD [Brachyspira hampsonii]|uniref:Streptolysin associated protein SagD n=1 Tax=Brachyspira hampsonii TaxID=1287055 RepID=A0A1E5NE78_9SPIR|nr:YcaO-like family protein [Brachyspira hampsonii]OEJ14469.1 streptolysin associated protein SagD [Brachyspira hampsonii]
MIKYYPSHKNILNKYNSICGHQTGIMDSLIIMQANSVIAKNINTCTAMLPDYHKILLGDNAEVNYHLSGYGIYRDEAVIRLLGEGIERYALFTANLYFEEKLKYASYNQLKEKYPDNIIPFEYVKIYSDEDCNKLNSIGILENITEDDVLSWVLLPSLFDKEKEYYVPAQNFFLSHIIRRDKKEKIFIGGFSKGSASHKSIPLALKSAVNEIIECDACMIKWYTESKVKEVIIDDDILNEVINSILKDIDYNIRVFDYTVDKKLGYVFTVMLVNKSEKSPYIVVGASSGLNPRKVIYRAFMEALAILTLNINGPLSMPADYLDTVSEKNYLNLDSNVNYWADAGNKDKNLKFINSKVQEKIELKKYKNLEVNTESDLEYLLKGLYNVSKYAVYLDITSAEISDKDLHVIRVYIPELVQMSMPAFPYSKHPRIINNGGISNNEFPHPLP